MELLRKLHIDVIYVNREMYDYNETALRIALERYHRDQVAILCHGGGNFGDLWYHHQALRNHVVTQFPAYKIRSFPQTLAFKQPEKLKEVQAIYAKHPDLELVARDTKSFDYAKTHFEKNRVTLLPDLAVMLFNKSQHFSVQARENVDVLVQGE